MANQKSGRSGCLLQSFLLGVVCIGGGIYLMQGWDALSGAAKAGAIVLTVIGTLLLLPALLIVALGLIVKYYFKRLTGEFKKVGEQIVAQNKAMFGDIHEFRDADDDDFDSLDRDLYEKTTSQLTNAGWTHLGDTVDATIEGMGQTSPVIRVLASPDGTTTLGIYQLNVPMIAEKIGRDDVMLCDLSSEFADGEFVTTANTAGLNMMTSPPQLHHRQLSPQTPLHELIEQHESEKQKLVAVKSGSSFLRVSTLGEALESEKRQQAIKASFRKGIGYVDPDEVRRIAHGMDSENADEIGDMAADAADRARQREKE